MDMHVIQQALPEILTQLLGFLIVFWILKTYAFGAILKTIDARRAKIEAEFKSIEQTRHTLSGLEAEYKKRIDRIEEEARAKIQEASRIGTELARDIQQKAREDAEKLMHRAQQDIAHDLAKAKIELREQVVEISMMAVEKVVRDKVDAAGHKKLVEKFIEEAGRLN